MEGLSSTMCVADELSTITAIIFGLVAFGVISLAAVAYMRMKSGTMYDASGIVFSPVTIAIGSLLAEVVDFVGDAFTCRNVLQSGDPRILAEGNLYLGLTILSGASFVVGCLERLRNLRWQMRRYNRKIQRKASAAKDKSSSIPA